MGSPIPHHDFVCACDDEGNCCPPCFHLKAEEMAAYFGIRPGMSSQERADQLARMDPRHPDAKSEAEFMREMDNA